MEELRTMVRQLIERQNTEAALAAAVRARAAANEAALAAGAGVRAGLTPSATVSSLAPSATVPSSTVTVSPVNPAVPANLGFPVAPVANPGANLAAKPVLPTNPVSPVNPVMNPVAAGSMAASPVTTMSPVASPALTLPIPEELHKYYTQLIQNAVADELAREVIARAKDRLNEWRVRLQAVGAGANKRESLDFQKLIPNALMDVIERMLPPTDPVHMVPGQGTKFVALVGPTGVGKTTTIAKLAAQFKLRERKKVALITTDTYRLAAVAQLKAYAEIMGVPIDVVYTPQELSDTMQKMQNYDVVLIDTSGRSQNDAEHLGGLQAFLTEARRTADAIAASARAAISAGAVAGAVADAKITASAKATANSKQLVGKNSKNGKNVAAGKGGKAKKIDAVASDAADATASSITAANGAQIGADGQEVVNSSYRPLETHLVLSCTSHPVQIKQILERFSRVGIDRVVFTKLDEAVGVGVILNIAHRLDVQLSYLTTGQDVPDDIEVGSRRRIAEMVLRPQKQEQAA
ncbi:MAG: hypothetical protein FWC56_05810 [Phycisphaerae bacterium]|nr:hypothetical protein [Phycisphaerae bacterium]